MKKVETTLHSINNPPIHNLSSLLTKHTQRSPLFLSLSLSLFHSMAMSDTMSGSGPNDWLHFYQQNFPGQVLPSSVSEATTVTTTVSATTTTTQLSPEGRVSKPIRRRSRASRRTPTTLLNTDTTNFRAMVQQFTGGPSAPFAPTSSSASAFPNMGFGFGSRPLHVNPNGLMLAPSSGFHLEQQPHLYPQQHFIYSANREGGDNTFVQNQRPTNPSPPNVTDQGGLFMDHGHGGRFFPTTSS